MKTINALLIGCVFAAGSAVVVAQDVVKVDPAHYQLITENAAVRILRVTYGPGDRSPTHSHPDHAVVILRGGRMQFVAPDGTKTEQDLPDDSALYAPGGTHANQSLSKTRIEAILIEFKTPKPGTAAVPTSRPEMMLTTLAEGPRAVVHTVTADPGFVEAAGTTHEYDQVVVALEPAQISLSLAGKPAKTSWARGDVQWIGRGTPHESRNTSGTPVTFAIVSIR